MVRCPACRSWVPAEESAGAGSQRVFRCADCGTTFGPGTEPREWHEEAARPSM